MKHLIPLLKEIELDLRANNSLSRNQYEKISELSDWELRIVQDFMLRVNMAKERNDFNFVYKFFEINSEDIATKKSDRDLMVCCLRRDKLDTMMTDVVNRLVMPRDVSMQTLEVWGMPVTRARNFCIQQACQQGYKYVLFIDDDIIAPNNAFLNIWKTYKETNNAVIAGNYCQKVEPLQSAHGKLNKIEDTDNLFSTDLCAMGFTFIDLQQVVSKVPFPLFWEFGAPDGYWSMGEDAFFTKNIKEYADITPIVNMNIKLLHYDKTWKKWYGEKDTESTYASNTINNVEQFDRLRVPDKFPIIAIGIPTRKQGDPIACNLDKLLMQRGYRSEFINVHNLPVDQARTTIVQQAIKLDAEYVLFIDDDIIPPEDGLVKMLDIIKDDKTIGAVSGEYLLKGKIPHSAHLQLDKEGIVTEFNLLKIPDNHVECNWLIGLGFALIRTEVFKQATPPWFMCHSKDFRRNPNDIPDANEDAHMSELVFINGYRIVMDQSIKCAHLDYKDGIIYTWYNETLENYAHFDWVGKFNILSLNQRKEVN